MKLTKRPFIVVFLTSLTLILTLIIAPFSAFAKELNVLGFKVTWSDTFYIPKEYSCSKFAFNYLNDTGGRLATAVIIVTDKYGQILSRASAVGVNTGVSGTWDLQMCESTFAGKEAPFEINVSIKDYFENTREQKGTATFVRIPNSGVSASPAPTASIAARPEPGPTVYVTNPADATLQDLVSSLKSQVSLLEKKLKKICAAKPKPKGC